MIITAAFIIGKTFGLQANWWWAVACFCGDMLIALSIGSKND